MEKKLIMEAHTGVALRLSSGPTFFKPSGNVIAVVVYTSDVKSYIRENPTPVSTTDPPLHSHGRSGDLSP